MKRDFDKDLQRRLKDPEFAAYFANAQAESAKKLYRTLTSLNSTSLSGKIRHYKWEFELTGDTGWVLTSGDKDGSALSYFTSRRKALLSIVRRVELLKPSKHFRLTLDDIDEKDKD